MSKLVYWKMKNCDGVNSSAMRFKTKREAMAAWDSFAPAYRALLQMPHDHDHDHGDLVDGVRESTDPEHCGFYETPIRVVATYYDGAFGLMLALTNECACDY
jgi:hypothetical protein